ncbi:ABC transporter ATP-binding protein [Microbacterium koreense]|uniref:ABC transporter ATP-binding protein n=1 Tax=Microbacterium koreense TaxID=323761 RepID=A0ABW2ZNV3_9MICO
MRDVAIRHEGQDAAVPAGVTFDISPGEVVLLLGPSGSGKSTLTLAMNGLIPHAVPATVSGAIDIAGIWTTDGTVAELSTHVAMVFQDPDAQLVTGTVLDEVAFGPENLRLPVDEVLTRSESALRRVGLWERRAENPDRLSGGGRQRLAIACALAMGAPLLVLDEPTANLDPRGIEEVYAALADLVTAGDRAILLVEHNLDAAADFVDRVVVLDHDGTVVADGTVDEVLRARAEELHDMGVWLPISTLAALRLRRAGYTLDPLPLTPAQLHAALTRHAPVATGRVAKSSNGPARPAIVRVRDLTVRRGRTDVLRGVDIDVAAGEFVAVVGANGAGKTTLLQAIAGVVPPPRGTVYVDGLDVGRTDARTLATRIGFVFQNPEHQFIAHTAFDEIAHGLRRQGLSPDEVDARAHALLDRFGLAHKADTHPFLLSGGQKRRLSVGTALVAGAPLLALDEPTFGQDRARADELLGLLRELNDEGTTVLVVTHDMQLVAEYADRTIVVGEGGILRSAPTADVFADDELVTRAGLRLPPLRQALQGLTAHPELARIARLGDLPDGRER